MCRRETKPVQVDTPVHASIHVTSHCLSPFLASRLFTSLSCLISFLSSRVLRNRRIFCEWYSVPWFDSLPSGWQAYLLKRNIFLTLSTPFTKYVNINGYLPRKIVKIMSEALVLIRKVQEDISLECGTRISSKTIYLHVCSRKKKSNLFLHFFQ